MRTDSNPKMIILEVGSDLRYSVLAALCLPFSDMPKYAEELALVVNRSTGQFELAVVKTAYRQDLKMEGRGPMRPVKVAESVWNGSLWIKL